MVSKTGVRLGCPGVRALLPAVMLAMSSLIATTLSGPAVGGAEPDAEAGHAAPAAAKPTVTGKLQHLGPTEAASILGRVVHGPTGQDIGRVIDVLVDRAGHPRAAVIDFGGFMGVGSRKVAVAWHLLRFAPTEKNKVITLKLTPDQIKAAPEYKPGKNPVVVTALPVPQGGEHPASPQTAPPAPPPSASPVAAAPGRN